MPAGLAYRSSASMALAPVHNWSPASSSPTNAAAQQPVNNPHALARRRRELALRHVAAETRIAGALILVLVGIRAETRGRFGVGCTLRYA